jgi:hypothetical protein
MVKPRHFMIIELRKEFDIDVENLWVKFGHGKKLFSINKFSVRI